MSGIFDASAGGPADAPAAKPASRRPRALLPTLAVVVVLVVLASVFVEVWTDRLWFGSLGYSEVFSTVLWTRIGLFVIFGLLLSATAVGNAYLAFRMRPILFADGYRNPSIERYQDMLDPVRRWVLLGLGVVLFLFGGASASGQWEKFLLWRNRVPFGQEDNYFNLDVGFYVFSYPWYRFLVSFGFTVLVVSLIVAIVTHYLYGGIRLQAARDKIASGAQIHLSVLLGLFMLVRAASYWLDRYGLVTSDGFFTGVSYTDANAVLPSKNILAIIALICAVLFFLNVFRPGWLLPVLGFGLLILSAILIGGIWPAIVQRFQVRPSETDKEAPYIVRNIEATRLAYDIDGVDVRPYAGTSTRTAEQLQEESQGLPGVRLIDPRLVAPAFEQLQQRRGFYSMPDLLDVDRYKFGDDATPRDVVIAVRELNLDGLSDDQRNWNNDHTVFTHGYGVVAAYGDVRGPSGAPVWAAQNLPTVGELGEFQQEVYYGETGPSYSIVGIPEGEPPVELNIPAIGSGEQAEDENSTYAGEGGVEIGSTFNQLLYSAKFWDSSILLSGRVNAESKIMYDRNPREMVEDVAPWLTVDGDAYPAVVDGRLLWIIDGYTTSDDYPMSQRVDLSDATNDSLSDASTVAAQQSDEINYIRNSVKATVDAYDGTVTLYEWDEEDPLLRAWMGAFPDSVQPKDEIPEPLLEHLRYPEDLFKVQRDLLATYHVTDPERFYSGSEKWVVPEDPTIGGDTAQPPFYLTVKLPDVGDKPSPSEFALTTVFVPQSRENLASFMSVNADPLSDEYGHMTVLELSSDAAVDGPGQVANAMQNDPQVANALLEYKQAESRALSGNLLTLPIGDELFYVQPIYTQRGGTGSYPILQYVLTSIGDQVGIGTSFESSFADALQLDEPSVQQPDPRPGPEPPPQPGDPGAGGGGEPEKTDEQLLDEALAAAEDAFQQAQAALNEGELGDYQTWNQRGLDHLEDAIELREQIQSGQPGTNGQPSGGGAGSGGGTPSEGGTPSDGGTPTDGQPSEAPGDAAPSPN